MTIHIIIAFFVLVDVVTGMKLETFGQSLHPSPYRNKTVYDRFRRYWAMKSWILQKIKVSYFSLQIDISTSKFNAETDSNEKNAKKVIFCPPNVVFPGAIPLF